MFKNLMIEWMETNIDALRDNNGVSKASTIYDFATWLDTLGLTTHGADQRYGGNPVSKNPTSYKICPLCRGQKVVYHLYRRRKVTCLQCKGKGQIPDEQT
jgi:hypothetical protein